MELRRVFSTNTTNPINVILRTDTACNYCTGTYTVCKQIGLMM
jgi:hypothetical protein